MLLVPVALMVLWTPSTDNSQGSKRDRILEVVHSPTLACSLEGRSLLIQMIQMIHLTYQTKSTKREWEMEVVHRLTLACTLAVPLSLKANLTESQLKGIMEVGHNVLRRWRVRQKAASRHGHPLASQQDALVPLMPANTAVVIQYAVRTEIRQIDHRKHYQLPKTKTSQELRMLSTVTLYCKVTKIVMNSVSQLSEL